MRQADRQETFERGGHKALQGRPIRFFYTGEELLGTGLTDAKP
jgi:hypothetical protein